MKTCIITGASQGIGRAAAIRMSRDPEVGNLVLIARSEEGLAATRDAMESDGKRIELVAFDLADLDAVPAMVKRVYEEFGSIDLLLNIAGYAEPAALLDTTTENIMTTFQVNVFALIVLTRECVKYMRHSASKILNVASTAGVTSRPGWLAYAASKAAVVSISNTLTDEMAEYGIKVYSISPGRCATELRRKLAPEEDPSTIMQPEDVAEVIATLMRDDETCLDGQNLIVRQAPTAGR
ncbi:MAG: SDR family oxidoreductase [Coriobacteriia bacterium]|nr:SDR family oxidoreductase [Actinomycetota bacterium]MDZ4166632.1 SDR family oxidoreductase [Coriobacteriia bacterium]